MDLIATIKANTPKLANPDTVAAAAAAIDVSYKRLWSDVYQLGTLACLRAGLLARNALYEGNAIAAIHRVLASSDPAAQAPDTAGHLLSILASLLQDVPAAFAAEGYAHLVCDAVDEDELIIPDTSELNALRAQPLFVTLALRTLLGRPGSCDREPHVSVGYLNDLICLESLDYITSAAMQGLLKDRQFREVLFGGLHSHDPHKLFKCLQLLKRCVGGGPGMLGGWPSTQHKLSQQWSLQQLLQLEAEQALVAACDSVALLARQHAIERQLLGLLHTTLLDVFDLLCAAEDEAADGCAGSSSSSSSSRIEGGGDCSIGEGRQAATAEGQAVTRTSSSSAWPAALVAAHMGVVIEVAKLVPFLITSLERMQPYASQLSAAAALEAAGPAAVAALTAVLAAGDPTDWPMLPHEVDGYKVMSALTQQSRQLALSALSAGAAGTIHAALVKWAAVMPAPDTLPGAQPQTPTADNDLNDLDLDPATRYEHTTSSSSGCSQGAGRWALPLDHAAATGVDSQVVGAAGAALQLLHTLLAAAAPADQTGGSSSPSSSSTISAAQAKPALGFEMPEDLPALLLELWHIRPLQQLAAGCLAQLQRLGLLSAAAGGHGNQQTVQQTAAAAASQQPGLLLGGEATGAAAGQVVGMSATRRGDQQQASGKAEGCCAVQESSRLLAQMKV